MKQKEKLLSIGEISKLTGAGIKALRHYEKINILKPSYVDPVSGYRYYRFSQTHVVELIRFAVELDIPLKEVTNYVDDLGNLDFEAFIARGNVLVRDKMKRLEGMLNFFDIFDEKLALQKEHQLKQFYTRRIPRKTFYTIPYEQSFDDVDHQEIAKLFLDLPHEDDLDGESGWFDYGFLFEHSPKGSKRYVFVELPQNSTLDAKNFERKIIPSGTYHCHQSNDYQIEHVTEIFNDYLKGKPNFTAIETEIYFCNYNINHPINELRVIAT